MALSTSQTSIRTPQLDGLTSQCQSEAIAFHIFSFCEHFAELSNIFISEPFIFNISISSATYHGLVIYGDLYS